ncbi:MAG TPA: hypothetical protein VG965_04000 [Patescibacteria group bacterium]|nr:hypothetical protein [Patescibacteria group bacterium]
MTNESEQFVPREVTEVRKKDKITAESLLSDNRSDKARTNITIWHENAAAGLLIESDTCGDARQEVPDLTRAVIVQSIGTAGSKEEYRGLINHRSIKAAVNVAHFAGNTVRPGVAPTGCGGLAAKEEMVAKGQQGSREGIGHYVENDIYHSDVIVQTCVSAIQMADMTDKPVLAAAQDHLTGIILPLIAFWTKGNTRYSIHNRSLTMDDILRPEKYSPSKIYRDGLPIIDEEDLPEVFHEYLMANTIETRDLHVKYPDFRERQTTQNPSTVLLSTDIRPPRLRLPESFDEPGSVFRLSLPRRKFANGTDISVEIPEKDLVSVVNQTQYPIEHFSNVENLIIETRDFQVSLDLMGHFMAKPWMKDWREKGGKQVILVETQGGRINRIADVKL